MVWHRSSSKSYQSGIEIAKGLIPFCPLLNSKSYQSGIEIQLYHLFSGRKIPLNRTKVELKSSWGVGIANMPEL